MNTTLSPVKTRPYIKPLKNLKKEFENLAHRHEVAVEVQAHGPHWFARRFWYAQGYGWHHANWLIVPTGSFMQPGQVVITEADYGRLKKASPIGKKVTVHRDVLEYRISIFTGPMHYHPDPIARAGDRVRIRRVHALWPLTVMVEPARGLAFEMFYANLQLTPLAHGEIDFTA